MNLPLHPPRQTQTYLRELFEARGLRPSSKLGQCFLIDLNLIDLIAREAELTVDDLVLEVGTGTGSMTTQMALLAGAVVGIEIDPGMYAIAYDYTRGLPNVKLLHADVLANKNKLNPELVQLLREGRERGSFKRFKLIANLPYVVATPVIANLLLLEDLPFERMVVTIQWELAARLPAIPSTPDYGGLSVLVQTLADVTLVRKLAPSAFWPKPKVDSAIVKIMPTAAKREAVGDVAGFREFIHQLYLHRRKNLRSGLIAFLSERFAKPELDERLARHGFDGKCRAETLSPEEHLRLWKALAA